MERSSSSSSHGGDPTLLPLHHHPATTGSSSSPPPPSPLRWPTVDGPLGLSSEEAETYARRLYKLGFFLLPFLWGINCFYFWPVLTHSRSFPSFRPYVVRSAIGFTIFTIVLCSWALTFSIGGKRLFGPVWDKLVVYNIADELDLTGLM